MKNCDAVHPISLFTIAAAESCSADFFGRCCSRQRSGFALLFRRPAGGDQTRLKGKNSASRRGIAFMSAAPLLKGRGNRQERSVYFLMAEGFRLTENTYRDPICSS